jgi:hypothetical protein
MVWFFNVSCIWVLAYTHCNCKPAVAICSPMFLGKQLWYIALVSCIWRWRQIQWIAIKWILKLKIVSSITHPHIWKLHMLWLSQGYDNLDHHNFVGKIEFFSMFKCTLLFIIILLTKVHITFVLVNAHRAYTLEVSSSHSRCLLGRPTDVTAMCIYSRWLDYLSQAAFL